ncbi:MAG: hypothetical protein U0T73_03210 [Chitinophagales bacterium]
MKKALAVIAALAVLAGCSDSKKLNDNIQGEWYIYKLIRYNIDETAFLTDSIKNYRITYSGNNYMEKNVFGTDTVYASGTWEFRNNLETLALKDTAGKERVYTIYNLEGNHVELRKDGESRYMRKTQ